jgi:hypothetical protein
MLPEIKLSFRYQQELCNFVLRFFPRRSRFPNQWTHAFRRLDLRGFVLTFCVVASMFTIASAQTTPAAPNKTEASKSATKSAEATLAPKPASNAAITLEGVCPAATAGGKAYAKTCKTVVTDAEMDRLIGALNPEMTGQVKENLGRSFAEWTAYAAKARELGLDKTPEFAELMKFARTQLLAQTLARSYQKKAEAITPTELQTYYDAHKSDFEEFNFLRVIVPRATPSKDKPRDEAAETQFAQQIRDRLAKGEDAKALQTEAFKHASQPAQEPPVEINGKKRGSLPASQAAIFDLKNGDVSQVLPDPSAFFIYKLVSRSIPPLDKSSSDVKKIIAKERLDKDVKDLNSQFEVKLSDSYFGPQAQGQNSVEGNAAGGKLTPEQEKMVQQKIEEMKKNQGAAPQTAPTTPEVPKQ